MKTISRITLLSAVVVVAGCGAAGDASSIPEEDRLSNDEAQAGESWAATHAEGASDDVATGAAGDSTAESDVLDPGALDERNVEPPQVNGVDETQACNAATGYRRGSAFRICVTYVDGKPVEVSTAAAYRRMRDAASRAGVSLRVVSGFRTMAEQRRLYALYKSGQGNLAAPPGYSNHQSGHALDLNTSSSGVYSWLSRHGGAYGFRRTVPSEKWHWEK